VANTQPLRDALLRIPLVALAIMVLFPISADGKGRDVCSQNGTMLWRDTRIPITRGAFNYLAAEGPVVSPYCSCVDLQKSCLDEKKLDCDAMFSECNGALNSGGSFCIPNKWGGQSCYK
jgi:hypothetical protein